MNGSGVGRRGVIEMQCSKDEQRVDMYAYCGKEVSIFIDFIQERGTFPRKFARNGCWFGRIFDHYATAKGI